MSNLYIDILNCGCNKIAYSNTPVVTDGQIFSFNKNQTKKKEEERREMRGMTTLESVIYRSKENTISFQKSALEEL